MNVPPSGPAAAQAPSGRRLLTATLVALAAGTIVLVTTVLPAEYGVDPLGTGRAMGLMELYDAGADVTGTATVIRTGDISAPLAPQPARYRVDATSFTLPPGEWMEYKYDLAEGATMVYTWTASAPVEFDFHTEPEGLGAAGSESFAQGEAREGHGSYRAAYPGIHGWYWRNLTRDDVTVTVRTAGFYTEARQFLRDGTTRAKFLDEVSVR